MTLPKPVPRLIGEAAERFDEIDKTPLSKEERKFLKECYEIYLRHPIHDSDRK